LLGGKDVQQVAQAAFDLGQQLGGYGNLNAVASEEVAHQGGKLA
jgi:hypothetical protein